MSRDDSSSETTDDSDRREVSRRKFLQWASYVPPAILGVLTTSSPAYAATCNPNACGPDCNPNASCGPEKACGPDGCNPDEPCPPEA